MGDLSEIELVLKLQKDGAAADRPGGDGSADG